MPAAANTMLRVLLIFGLAYSAMAVKCYQSDIAKMAGAGDMRGNYKQVLQPDNEAWCYNVTVNIYAAPLSGKAPARITGTYVSGLLASAGICNGTTIYADLLTLASASFFSGTSMVIREYKDWKCCTTDLCNTGSNLDLAEVSALHSASMLAVLLAALLAMVVARM